MSDEQSLDPGDPIALAQAATGSERLHRLSDRQILALDALLAGATQAQAAEVAGVHRVTVTKWASRHPAFAAELNRQRGYRMDAVADAVLDVTLKAVGVAREAVESGDVDAALGWLKLAGVSAFVALRDRQRAGRPTTSDAELDRQARQHSDLHGPLAFFGDDSRRTVEHALLADPDLAG